MTGTPMRLLCRAKVNLTLEVIGKRPDGYHELVSLAHTISLADRLTIRASDQLSCEVRGMELAENENLVLRAARCLRESARLSAGAAITLEKGVPAAAGLGGGSSDAAAALVALRCFWGARLPVEEMSTLASELGSDVPYFLRGGAAVLRGRGERLEAAPPQQGRLVVVVPDHHMVGKTGALYATLRPSDLSDGTETERVVTRLRRGAALADGDLCNAFERPARELFDDLDHVWRDAERRTGRRFHLSGAGPAIFALAADRDDAEQLRERLLAPQLRVYVTELVNSSRSADQG